METAECYDILHDAWRVTMALHYSRVETGVQLVRGAGGRYLGARMSGSKAAAEQGTLIFLTEGDRDAFEAVSPMLDVKGKANYFFEEVCWAKPILVSLKPYVQRSGEGRCVRWNPTLR